MTNSTGGGTWRLANGMLSPLGLSFVLQAIAEKTEYNRSVNELQRMCMKQNTEDEAKQSAFVLFNMMLRMENEATFDDLDKTKLREDAQALFTEAFGTDKVPPMEQVPRLGTAGREDIINRNFDIMHKFVAIWIEGHTDPMIIPHTTQRLVDLFNKAKTNLGSRQTTPIPAGQDNGRRSAPSSRDEPRDRAASEPIQRPVHDYLASDRVYNRHQFTQVEEGRNPQHQIPRGVTEERYATMEQPRHEPSRFHPERMDRYEPDRFYWDQRDRYENDRVHMEQMERKEATRISNEQMERKEATRLRNEQMDREDAIRLRKEQMDLQEAIRASHELMESLQIIDILEEEDKAKKAAKAAAAAKLPPANQKKFSLTRKLVCALAWNVVFISSLIVWIVVYMILLRGYYVASYTSIFIMNIRNSNRRGIKLQQLSVDGCFIQERRDAFRAFYVELLEFIESIA